MAKNFSKSLMASEDIQSLMYTGVFFDGSDTEAECHNGALVVKGGIMDHSVYEGMKDPNVRKITAPKAQTDEVHVVDYVDVSSGDIAGVRYRDGIKTFGLVAPAGKEVRVRIPMKHDTGYFAAENFVGTPAAGKFAVPTANSTLWTVVDAADSTSTCIAIEFEKNTTEGTVNTGKEYFVTFINVI